MANRIGGPHWKISENLAGDVQFLGDPGSRRAMAGSELGLWYSSLVRPHRDEFAA